MAEKSLLQKIREKELEMNVLIDQERGRADQVLDQANKEASSLIAVSEREGRREAEEYLEREMEAIRTEADRLRVSLVEEEAEIRRRGEANLPGAVEEITRLVLSG